MDQNKNHQDDNRGNQGAPGSTERGRGSQGERNRGEGISNRGMDRESER